MIKKVQVSVTVAELSEENDFMIPLDMKVLDAIQLIIDVFSQGGSLPIETRMKRLHMFNIDKATLCKADMSFAECGITRGSKLIII